MQIKKILGCLAFTLALSACDESDVDIVIDDEQKVEESDKGITADGCIIIDEYISEDTTWDKSCYQLSSVFQVNANLTIQAGTTLRFEDGADFYITATGSLTAIGTQENPITFTAVQKTAGYWYGIEFYDSNNVKNQLEFVTIEYAGAGSETDAALEVDQSRIKISNTSVTHSLNNGLLVDEDSNIDAFSNNIFTNNGRAPIIIDPNLAGILDAESQYSGNGMDYINFSYGHVSSEQTWKLLDVPYQLTWNMNIEDSLTVAAGVKVISQDGVQIDVRPDGSLNAIGTKEAPIIFTGAQQTAGYWHGINFVSNNVKNHLDFVTIEYAGSADEGALNLEDSTTKTRIKISNSTFQYNLSYGISMMDEVIIDEFTSNTLSNNEVAAIKLPQNLVGALASGNSFSGNEEDYIVVKWGSGYITDDQTWAKHDASYYMDTDLNVKAQLTIEAGARLLFKTQNELEVYPEGRLLATGTADEPILFSATQATPGYWQGIKFRASAANNVLQYAVIENAGASPSDNTPGAVVIEYWNEIPVTVLVENTTIRNSGSHGIYMEPGTELTVTLNGNIFEQIALNDVFIDD